MPTRPRKSVVAKVATPVSMAGKRSISRTLSATPSTDDAVTYPVGAFVEIINRSILTDGTGDIWYTLDNSVPTVGGAGCRPLPAGASDRWDAPDAGTGTLRLISATASVPYTVQV